MNRLKLQFPCITITEQLFGYIHGRFKVVIIIAFHSYILWVGVIDLVISTTVNLYQHGHMVKHTEKNSLSSNCLVCFYCFDNFVQRSLSMWCCTHATHISEVVFPSLTWVSRYGCRLMFIQNLRNTHFIFNLPLSSFFSYDYNYYFSATFGLPSVVCIPRIRSVFVSAQTRGTDKAPM